MLIFTCEKFTENSRVFLRFGVYFQRETTLASLKYPTTLFMLKLRV